MPGTVLVPKAQEESSRPEGQGVKEALVRGRELSRTVKTELTALLTKERWKAQTRGN